MIDQGFQKAKRICKGFIGGFTNCCYKVCSELYRASYPGVSFSLAVI